MGEAYFAQAENTITSGNWEICRAGLDPGRRVRAMEVMSGVD